MIEVLVVMTLIIVLASMGMTQYRNSVTRAEEAVLKEDLFRMNDAIDQYYADKNKYPADLADLVSEGYLREVPVDPMTKSKDTWTTTQAEPDANNPASQVGIYSVKSGSDRTALDGTRYSDW
jgi:general secretion pathway protein G